MLIVSAADQKARVPSPYWELGSKERIWKSFYYALRLSSDLNSFESLIVFLVSWREILRRRDGDGKVKRETKKADKGLWDLCKKYKSKSYFCLFGHLIIVTFKRHKNSNLKKKFSTNFKNILKKVSWRRFFFNFYSTKNLNFNLFLLS